MVFSEWIALSALALSVLFGAVLVVQIIRLGRVEKGYRGLMKGSGPGAAPLSIGEIITNHGSRLEATRIEIDGMKKALSLLEASVARSVQNVGLVRYNPFGDTGGDQSFALALLDARGDGIIISSLHGRTATRFYAKPVKAGASLLSLSEEEKEALEQAMGK